MYTYVFDEEEVKARRFTPEFSPDYQGRSDHRREYCRD